jgi:hypothetical protein
VLRRVESFQYELRFEAVGPRYLPGFMLGKAIKLFQEQQGNEDHTLILVYLGCSASTVMATCRGATCCLIYFPKYMDFIPYTTQHQRLSIIHNPFACKCNPLSLSHSVSSHSFNLTSPQHSHSALSSKMCPDHWNILRCLHWSWKQVRSKVALELSLLPISPSASASGAELWPLSHRLEYRLHEV